MQGGVKEVGGQRPCHNVDLFVPVKRLKYPLIFLHFGPILITFRASKIQGSAWPRTKKPEKRVE